MVAHAAAQDGIFAVKVHIERVYVGQDLRRFVRHVFKVHGIFDLTVFGDELGIGFDRQIPDLRRQDNAPDPRAAERHFSRAQPAKAVIYSAAVAEFYREVPGDRQKLVKYRGSRFYVL